MLALTLLYGEQIVALPPFCTTTVIQEQNVRATFDRYNKFLQSRYKHALIVLYGINEVFQIPLLKYFPALTHPNLQAAF